jgi:hypothetical protein
LPGATESVSDTSDTVARGLLTGVLSSARAGIAVATSDAITRTVLSIRNMGFL